MGLHLYFDSLLYYCTAMVNSQWFSARSDIPSQKIFDNVWRYFGCHDSGWGLLPSSGERPGLLLTSPQSTDHKLTTNSFPALNFISAKIEKSWSKGIPVRSFRNSLITSDLFKNGKHPFQRNSLLVL